VNKITFQEAGHVYTNEQGVVIPSVSQILQHFGISNYAGVDSGVLARKADLGTDVHQVCEEYDTDELWAVEPKDAPYLDQWIEFRKKYKFSPFIGVEVPLYSKTWGFGVTPDRFTGDTLIEIKLTVKQEKSHQIQMAFQKIVVEENFKIKIKYRLCIYLKKNGYKVVEFKDKMDEQIAKSLVQVYNWKKVNKLNMEG